MPHKQPQSCVSSCCGDGCSTNCDNTTDWNGRCCNWESFPAEMSNMFDGLVVNFGPTDIEVGTDRWRSEIIDLPGSFVTGLECQFVPQIFLGTGFYVSGSANLGLSFSGFKLALHRTNTGNASCTQIYNMWFGLSFSVSSVNTLNAIIRNALTPRHNEVWRTTDPLDLVLESGDPIVGHSVVRPCDGSNTSSNGGYGARGLFGLGATEGVTTSNCDAEMPLRFGWAIPFSIPIKILPPYFISNPVSGVMSVPTWVGCGVQGFANTNGFIGGVTPNSTKLPMTVKRSTSWGICPNLPINLTGQPNLGIQINRGLTI